MGKLIPDTTLDQLLTYIQNNATKMHVTSDSDTPTHCNNSLAVVDMVPGDFTIEEGDGGAGSRKITIATKTDVDVTADGTPEHVILANDDCSEMFLITTCLGPDVTIGSKIDFPEWKYELAKPV